MTKAQKKFTELTEWVRSYNGDVDRSAFLDTCDEVLQLHFRELGLRIPSCLLQQGADTLDAYCALTRQWLPNAPWPGRATAKVYHGR